MAPQLQSPSKPNNIHTPSQPPQTTSTLPKKIQKPTRRARKHQPDSTRCWDWLLLPASSNTHFAKNRASFETYRRAPCKIANQRVLGVGTVQLRVRRAPNDPRTTTLVLRDVLHMPHARCNGISVAKFTGDFCDDCGVGRDGEGGWRRGSGTGSGRGSVGGQSESEEGEWVGETEGPLPVVVGVEGEGEAEHLQVRRASTTSTISSSGGGEEDRGEGLWFAEGRPERGCSRVVLAGQQHRHHQSLDVGELANEQMLKGLVVSKEELELLNERVRNRSWV